MKTEKVRIGFYISAQLDRRLTLAAMRYGHGTISRVAESGIKSTLDRIEKEGIGVIYREEEGKENSRTP